MIQSTLTQAKNLQNTSESKQMEMAWHGFLQIAEKTQIPDDFMVDRGEKFSKDRGILNESSE